MKDFKYKAVFASKIKPLASEDLDKYLAVASADLTKYFPKEIDFNKKIDLLGIYGQAFTANRLNANGDGVETKEAIELANLLPYSFIDLDHNRNNIIGVAVAAYYSEFGTGKELKLEDIKDYKKPFSVSVASVLWRVINPELSDYVEKSADPNSDNYNSLFYSWEVGFDKFNLLAIQANKDNFEDGELITDPEEINRLSQFLRAEGGKGVDDKGRKIGRVPVGQVIPMAFAITDRPAAQLTPLEVFVKKENIEENKDSKADFTGYAPETKEAYSDKQKSIDPTPKSIKSPNKNVKEGQDKVNTTEKEKHLIKVNPDYKFGVCPSCQYKSDYQTLVKNWDSLAGECPSCKKVSDVTTWEYTKDSANNEVRNGVNAEILSQSNSLDVNSHENKLMKITNIKDLTDDSMKECKAADVQALVSAEIQKINDSFVKEREEKEQSITKANAALEETRKNYTEMEKKYNDMKAEMDKLVEANTQREKLAVFSARMSTIDEKFELNDKEKEIVASKVKNLGDDADFNKYMEEIDVLLAAKKKGGKKEDKGGEKAGDKKNDKEQDADADDEEMDAKKKACKASINDVEGAIKDGKKEDKTIPNTTDNTQQLSLAEKAKKAFSKDAITIGHSWDIKRNNKNSQN